MNQLIPRIGAATVTVTVFLFAVCLIAGFDFGAYLVCMALPIGYMMMAAGFYHESDENRRVAALLGLMLSGIYAALILLVYDAQLTTVRLDALNDQAARMLDFRRGGLMFNYDLLGYGVMALSTLLLGLSMEADDRADKWLKGLLMIHGCFFVGCLVMPMTGAFSGMVGGETSMGGVAALVGWCVYFLPVGALAYRHFRRG